MEIVQERLEREFNLNLVITSPSVEVKLKLTNGEEKLIDNPANFPSHQYIEKCNEPFINALIIVSTNYLGNIISLCLDWLGHLYHKKGEYKKENEVLLKVIELNTIHFRNWYYLGRSYLEIDDHIEAIKVS